MDKFSSLWLGLGLLGIFCAGLGERVGPVCIRDMNCDECLGRGCWWAILQNSTYCYRYGQIIIGSWNWTLGPGNNCPITTTTTSTTTTTTTTTAPTNTTSTTAPISSPPLSVGLSIAIGMLSMLVLVFLLACLGLYVLKRRYRTEVEARIPWIRYRPFSGDLNVQTDEIEIGGLNGDEDEDEIVMEPPPQLVPLPSIAERVLGTISPTGTVRTGSGRISRRPDFFGNRRQ